MDKEEEDFLPGGMLGFSDGWQGKPFSGVGVARGELHWVFGYLQSRLLTADVTENCEMAHVAFRIDISRYIIRH